MILFFDLYYANTNFVLRISCLMSSNLSYLQSHTVSDITVNEFCILCRYLYQVLIFFKLISRNSYFILFGIFIDFVESIPKAIVQLFFYLIYNIEDVMQVIFLFTLYQSKYLSQALLDI